MAKKKPKWVEERNRFGAVTSYELRLEHMRLLVHKHIDYPGAWLLDAKIYSLPKDTPRGLAGGGANGTEIASEKEQRDLAEAAMKSSIRYMEELVSRLQEDLNQLKSSQRQ